MLATALYCLVALVWSGDQGEAADRKWDRTLKSIERGIRDWQKRYETVRVIRQIVEGKSIDQLENLLACRSATVALHATWQRVVLLSDRVSDTYPPDERAIEYFLGFITGRLRVRPPQWWRVSLREAVHPAECLDTLLIPGQGDLLNLHVIEVRAKETWWTCYAPRSLRIETDGESCWIILAGQKRRLMPATQPLSPNAEFVTAAFTKDATYVAFSHPVGGFVHVFKLDLHGKVMWESRAWAALATGSWGPTMPVILEVVPSHHAILLFGAMPGRWSFLEGFRADTGEPMLRWCSCYYLSRSPNQGRQGCRSARP